MGNDSIDNHHWHLLIIDNSSVAKPAASTARIACWSGLRVWSWRQGLSHPILGPHGTNTMRHHHWLALVYLYKMVTCHQENGSAMVSVHFHAPASLAVIQRIDWHFIMPLTEFWLSCSQVVMAGIECSARSDRQSSRLDRATRRDEICIANDFLSRKWCTYGGWQRQDVNSWSKGCDWMPTINCVCKTVVHRGFCIFCTVGIYVGCVLIIAQAQWEACTAIQTNMTWEQHWNYPKCLFRAQYNESAVAKNGILPKNLKPSLCQFTIDLVPYRSLAKTTYMFCGYMANPSHPKNTKKLT